VAQAPCPEAVYSETPGEDHTAQWTVPASLTGCAELSVAMAEGPSDYYHTTTVRFATFAIDMNWFTVE
jgi:hypothetical protein